MTTLPLTQALLLEINQSLGCKGYPTIKSEKFAQGQANLETVQTMGPEILQSIFEALDIDAQAQRDATDALLQFGNAYKFLELNTWTFAADQRQVLWALLGHFYVPGLARRLGFWNLGSTLDKGMPGGRFWYLPEPREADGSTTIYMPIAQVVDWLLDLLGEPTEEAAHQLGTSESGKPVDLCRSLYNWRKGTTIQPGKIETHFSDSAKLDFKGTFEPKSGETPSEQFDKALDFARGKRLTADTLRLEIPMTQEGRLEAILAKQAGAEEQSTFVHCLAERYAPPSMRTIRQRLRVARMVQDGYTRLLKLLCPGVDRLCANAQQNKLLQLFALYKLVYNLTLDAWRHCGHLGESAENQWFEQHLPPWEKHSLLLSVVPSLRDIGNDVLAHWLTRQFFDMQPEAPLEDHCPLDAASAPAIIQRKLERIQAFDDEMVREHQLIERIKASSPWRALQGESEYWVIWQVAQNPTISPLAKQAATQRLRELKPAQPMPPILLELHDYLHAESRHSPKDVRARVQALLDEAAASEGCMLWKAPLLQYKAKHLLACNDFESAGRCFREALEAGLERNYGPLQGEVGRAALALEIANKPLIANHHEKYYRAILSGDIVDCTDGIPSMPEVARQVSEYFWSTLYKPYPGVQAEQRRSAQKVKDIFANLMPLLHAGNQEGMQKWIKAHRALFTSRLPDVEGNSVLMALIKMRSHFQLFPSSVLQMAPTALQDQAQRWNAMLGHWQWLIEELSREASKQLNMPDLKGQTPLMLMAEEGDTQLVQAMLQAGADPDLQDLQGMTALHSACKSRVDGCVDALLNHPCNLDKQTHEGRPPLHTASWAGHVYAVQRLSQLEPRLVWQRDQFGQTPLELAEHLLDHPHALQALADARAQSGGRCASAHELKEIVQVFETLPSVH